MTAWRRASLVLVAAVSAIHAWTAVPAFAQQNTGYPTKPVRLINPFPPGGGSDAVAHLVSQRLFERWGQSIVVDNRGGAGGSIGTELAARSVPDGYTLIMATASTLVINPLLNKVPFDPIKDFDAVIHTSTIPLVFMVNPKVPARSVSELIALAKAQPGKLNFSSSGEGTISHLAGELFKNLTGVNMTHVPYRGGGPARTALLGGHVQMNFGNLLSAAADLKVERLRAIGVTTKKRVSSLPTVPTLAEAGLPGYEVEQWNGILIPRGAPKAIIAKLNTEINKIIEMPEIQKILINSGAEPEGGTPDVFAAFLKADIAKWAKVISDAKLNVNR